MMLTGLFVTAMLLASSVIPASGGQAAPVAAPAAVSVPDTPAGKALNEFVASFNAGGDKRRAWLEERTTADNEMRERVLEQDVAILEQQGPMKVVRVADSSPTQIVGIVHHEKSGAHLHLTITVEAAAPHKVSNMWMRPATPDEVKGQSTASAGISAQDPTAAERQGRAYIEVLSTGDRATVRRFVEAHFSSEMLGRPMEQHLTFASTLYDTSRGYEVVNVQEAAPQGTTLLLRSKLTGAYSAMFFGVEDTAPFKITGIGGRPPKAPAVASRTLDDAAIREELTGFLKRLADADVFSGAVLLAKDGVPVFKAAYGTANKDYGVPNTIDTKFNLGSMNKMFTAVAVAQLVEKGKLAFDDALSKFIPDFPDAESARKIQVKHLLSHTAGLGPYFSRRYQDTPRNKLRTVDDMMALAKEDERLLFEPGTKWQYSNTGMLVLGKIVEIVSGQNYFDYVRENIYKPAGMTNTDAYELDKVNPNLAVGYHKTFTDDGIVWSNNVFEHVMRGGPHGGGYSTVEDLLRFDQALRSGQLVSPAMVKVLTTPKPELSSPGYGYGFAVNTAAGTAGHSGGFIGISSNMIMFVNSGWTAILMSNYSGAGGPVMEKMRALIMQSDSQGSSRR